MGKRLGSFLIGAVMIGASFIPGLPGVAATILLGSGVGMASRAVFRPAGIGERITALQQQIASNVAELPVCYGRNRIGLRLVDIRLKLSDSKRIILVGAVSHGPDLGGGVLGFGEVYIDDRVAVTVDGDVAPAFIVDGNERITYVGLHTGTNTQSADSKLTTDYAESGAGWSAAHRGQGIAYVVLECRFDAAVFSSLPEVSAIVYGVKVYDLRDHTVKYSTNPMLCLWDMLMSERYGPGVGRRKYFDASQVTASGMGSFSAANTANDVHDDVAWHTNSASSGAYVRVDYGVPVEITRCAIWTSYIAPRGAGGGGGGFPYPGTTDQNAGVYDVEYSDDGSSWSTAITGFRPRLPRRNYIYWGNRGAHRYWRVKLTNTPGTGASLAGLEFYEHELDDAAFIEEANHCDDEVLQPADDSAYQVITAATATTPIRITKNGHGLFDGDQINIKQQTIVAPGINILGDWTVDVINANQFDLVGSVGAGSYVASSAAFAALVTRTRFSCSGVVDTVNPVEESVRQILSSCRGNLVWESGRYRPFIRKPKSPTFALTADDIVGPIRVILPSVRDQKNVGRGTFVDPDQNWQPDSVIWPETDQLNPYQEADGGFESDGDFEMPFTQDKYQAEQIVMVGVKESRTGNLVQFTAKERALAIRCGDVGTVTHETFGWESQPVSVEAIAIDAMTGQLQLTLREYNEEAYTLDPHRFRAIPPDTSLPNALGKPEALTGLVLTSSDSEYIATESGEYLQRIRVQWDPATNPFADYVQVRAKHIGQAEFSIVGTAEPDGEFYISPVVAEVEWTVEVRVVTTLGKVSDWLSGTITPSTYTRPLPIGVVDFFDDFPGTPDRWDVAFGGTTAIVVGGDAALGGRVLQVTEVVQATWKNFIPIDRRALYSLRIRIRKVRDSSDGGTYIDAGFCCYNEKQEPIFPYSGGVAGGDVVAPVAMNQQDPPLSLSFTEYRGYALGWNGSWLSPAAASLSQSGLGNYTAANVGDGDPSSKGFDVDSASAGAYLRLNPGGALFIRGIRLYRSASGGSAQWKVQYSDDGSTWHDVTFRGGGSTWTPTLAGWNQIDWDAPNDGVVQNYWRLYLNNTPGSGPDIHDVGFLRVDNAGYTGPADPSFFGTPVKFPPGTAYIKPAIFFFGAGLTPAIYEVDMIELPPAAGAPILL